MVGMQATFGAPTPHGGAPFSAWKKGFGFGRAGGPGQYFEDPSTPTLLRFTPKGDRGFASSPFWRGKYEVGQASSFGLGDRPNYTPKESANGNISPDNYGDIAPLLQHAKRNATRAGITMKAGFETFDQKLKANPAHGGPGPGKYNCSYKTGQSSWSYPAKVCSFTILPRPAMSSAELAGMETPGPGDYKIDIPCGTNPPYKHGTLYDITMKSRAKVVEAPPGAPGPGKYQILGELDHYTLGTMIANVKVPKSRSTPILVQSGEYAARRDRDPRTTRASVL